MQNLTAVTVSLLLFGLVGVVVKRGDRGVLDGSRHHQPHVTAHGNQLGDEVRVASEPAGAVRRHVRRLGQRVNSQQVGEITVAHSRVENTDWLFSPAEPQVALVRSDDDVPSTSPLNHLAQVFNTEDLAVGVARGIDEHQRRRGGTDLRQRVRTQQLSACDANADLVGGICQLGDDDGMPRAYAEEEGKPANRFLGADDRKHIAAIDR